MLWQVGFSYLKSNYQILFMKHIITKGSYTIFFSGKLYELYKFFLNVF